MNWTIGDEAEIANTGTWISDGVVFKSSNYLIPKSPNPFLPATRRPFTILRITTPVPRLI
jgi:hypothetical protein